MKSQVLFFLSLKIGNVGDLLCVGRCAGCRGEVNDTGLEQRRTLNYKGALILGTTGGWREFQSALETYAGFPRCGHVRAVLERRLVAVISGSP